MSTRIAARSEQSKPNGRASVPHRAHQADSGAESGLPVAADSEEFVVGALIRLPERIAAVTEIVSAVDFYDPLHRGAFRELVAMERCGAAIDVIAVRDRLSGVPEFEGQNTGFYLANAGRAADPPLNVEYHARRVAKVAKAHRVFLALNDAKLRIGRVDPEEIAADLFAEIDDVMQASERRTRPDVFEQWAEGVLSRQKPARFVCAPLGSRLREVQLGEGLVTLFGAPPGVGKTALVSQLLTDALKAYGQEDLRALVANVEMSAPSLLNRWLARETGVGHAWILHRDYDDAARERLEAGIEALRDLVSRIEFMGPPFTLDRLAERAARSEANIVVVDYCQRFDFATRSSDQRAQTNAVMDVCRRIADQGRAVVVVSAVNRQGYNRDSAGLGSFRESSELEYGSDAAYLLLQDPQEPSAIELKCVKNRHGQMRDIPLRFDGSKQTFTDELSSEEWDD